MAAVPWYTLRHWTADKLGDCVLGTLTGGSGTTLIDAVMRKEADDYWLGVYAKVYSGTGSGQERLLTDSTQSSGTLTHTGSSYGVTPLSGALYELHSHFSADEYDRFLKQALTTLTRRRKLLQWKYDDSSLVWVADQLDYSVPAGFVGLLDVELATVSGTPGSDDYQMAPRDSWYIRHTTTRKVVFSAGFGQYTAGYAMRLSGYQEFAQPTADSDTYELDPAALTTLAAFLAAEALAVQDPSGRWGQVADRLRTMAREEEDRIQFQATTAIKWTEPL